MNYHFSDPKNTACLVCNHVLEQGYPILYVTHDEDDGMWQFLCGVNDHKAEQGKIIGLSVAVNLDQSLNELSNMPIGFGARRQSFDKKWDEFKL